MNNQKMRLLSLVLAAAVLGSVTAFADGEPAAPETTETTEIASRETEGSWSGNTYTDNQGIVYELNDDGQTVTLTNGRSATGAITIPDAIEKDGTSYPVTSVGGKAFVNCWQLVSVTFSGNVDSIGDTAFLGCDALKTLTFYGNVGSIGDTAFFSCYQLNTVTFSGDVGSIGREAFYNCRHLNTVTFSGKVGSIGTDAFGFCTELESVTFSGDVGSIGLGAFENCTELESVTFSGDVGSIEDGAFWNCTKLETIYVPASMTEDKIQEIQEALESSGLPLDQVQIVQPEKPVDPATGTPSAPATGTTSATGSTSPTVQQLEAAERPDPMDVEATERYNFWMDVKSDLRAAADGKTLRVHVPADYTNMPASVMEQIRLLEKYITVDLRWSGERLLITPETAVERPALKAFWTFEQLCELYAQ